MFYGIYAFRPAVTPESVQIGIVLLLCIALHSVIDVDAFGDQAKTDWS